MITRQTTARSHLAQGNVELVLGQAFCLRIDLSGYSLLNPVRNEYIVMLGARPVATAELEAFADEYQQVCIQCRSFTITIIHWAVQSTPACFGRPIYHCN